jgi:iron complex outermembrane receptor protein
MKHSTVFARILACIFCCVLLCSTGTIPAFSQAKLGTITGSTVNEDNEVIGKATIFLYKKDATSYMKKVIAKADGSFEFANVPEGEYTIVVAKSGFVSSTFDLAVTNGKVSTIATRMETTAYNLDELIVSASRRTERLNNAPASVSVVGSKQINQEVSLSPETSLRKLAGVDVQTVGIDRQQIAVRGFSNPLLPTALMMVDYRNGMVPTVNINLFNLMPASNLDIDRMEVVRGPGSSIYGPGADVGVVHAITKNPFDYQGTSVSLGAGERNSYMGAVRHAQQLGDKFAYKINASYSQARDWALDTADPADRFEVSRYNGPRKSRDQETWKYYTSLTGVYKMDEESEITVDAGIAATKNIILSGAAAQLLDNYRMGYGQIRYKSGGLFANLYATRGQVDDWYQYSNGVVFKDASSLYNGQVQYDFDFMGTNILVGGDFRMQNPVTEGTLTGRNEGNASVRETGAYFQFQKDIISNLRFTLGGRVDNNSALDVTAFSPRAALVYNPNASTTLRASYNRAINSPTPLNVFIDIRAARLGVPGGQLGQVDLLLRGGNSMFTFDGTPGNRVSTSLIDTIGYRKTGVGIDYKDAYSFMLGDTALRNQFGNILNRLAGVTNVDGFQSGEMRMPGSTVAINDPLPIDYLQKPTVTQMYELGYKGVIADKILVAVDVYYATKQNFLGPSEQIAPYVYTPNFDVNAFRTSLVQAFQANPDLLVEAGRTADQLADDLVSAASTRMNALRTSAVGIVQPTQNTIDGQRPTLLLGYRNFGNVSYYGVDASVEAEITKNLSVFGTWSWMSDNDFNNTELGETNTQYSVPMNSPRIRWRLGANYSEPSSWRANIAMRYQDGFRVGVGNFRGFVPEFTVFDAGIGYDLSNLVKDLSLDIFVTNIFDNRIREFVGAPLIGRYGMARVTYSL